MFQNSIPVIFWCYFFPPSQYVFFFLTVYLSVLGVYSVQPGVRVPENGLHHVWRSVSHSGHQCCHQQGTAPNVITIIIIINIVR